MQANKEKITERMFPQWVLDEGGLDAIKRNIAKERKRDRPPKKQSVIERQVGERLKTALLAAGQAQILRQHAYLDVEELQKISVAGPGRRPMYPVVIRREANGAVTIQSFKLPGSTRESMPDESASNAFTQDESGPDEAPQFV
jgi:hypothetical protein